MKNLMNNIFDELTIDNELFREVKFYLNEALKEAAEKINEDNKVKITLTMDFGIDEEKTYETAPNEKLLKNINFNIKTDITEKAFNVKDRTEQIAISKDGQSFLARKADMQIDVVDYIHE